MSRNVLWVFAFTMILTVSFSTLVVGISGSDKRALIYESAPSIPPDAYAVLTSLAQSLTPSELTALKSQLEGGNQIWSQSTKASSSSPLSEYLQTATNASSNIVQIGTLVDHARMSLAIGNDESAAKDIRTLNVLTYETQRLLNASMRLLGNVSATYGLDTSVQVSRIVQLNETLQGYLVQINELKTELSQKSIQSTALFVNSSVSQVFVEDSFMVDGFLKWNGIPLTGRSIEISWELNNESVTTNATGGFQTELLFPFGTTPGTTAVEAFYAPSGNDSLLYRAAYSEVLVTVAYEETRLSATIDRSILMPSNSTLINGQLEGSAGQPLSGQPILINLGSIVIGDTTTLANGAYYFILTVPETVRNGTYTIALNFSPITGRYAGSSASLQLQVVTFPSRVGMKPAQNSTFSGMNLTITGGITYLNGTAIKGGTVAVYLDDVFYANVTTTTKGTFQYSLGLPIWLGYGRHSLSVQYFPRDPWIDSSESTALVYVINTPLTGFALVALIGGVAGSLVVFRRRRVTVRRVPAEAEAITEKRIFVFPTTVPTEQLLTEIQAETDSNLKVRKTFALAKAMIDAELGERSVVSETAWEYCRRVAARLPQINDSLKQLTELFELADYSQFAISQAQSDLALNALASIQFVLKG